MAVEITPEMIDAGGDTLLSSGWPDDCNAFEAARLVYRAMDLAVSSREGSIPKPHQLIIDHSGVTRWSPLFDSIKIEQLPQTGKRIRITIKSDNMVDFDLTEEQITHLVALLLAKLDEKA